MKIFENFIFQISFCWLEKRYQNIFNKIIIIYITYTSNKANKKQCISIHDSNNFDSPKDFKVKVLGIHSKSELQIIKRSPFRNTLNELLKRNEL